MTRPYPDDAPWPCMRGGLLNTGYRPEPARLPSERTIRHFDTDNAVLSTPVLGAGDRLYVGSADHGFYAFDTSSGECLWRFGTGEVIDSSACISPAGVIYVPGGDARMYGLSFDGEEVWRFDLMAERTQVSPSTLYWWEGNVGLGPNGWLYAGNDDFHFYAIDPGPDGGVQWSTPTGLHIWSAPAFANGLVYAASFDTHLYAFDQITGEVRWSTPLGNFVVASPAIGEDGAVFVGGFDGQLYAIDGDSGTVRWTMRTGGPIYASVALAPDGTLYVGSTDGNLYCVDQATGATKWTRYLADPIRSSASVGPDPERDGGYLVYVGGGDGVLYAFEPSGGCRWAYDARVLGPPVTTSSLNASVALGRHGLATASSNGQSNFDW